MRHHSIDPFTNPSSRLLTGWNRLSSTFMTGPPRQDFRPVRVRFGRRPADPVTGQSAPGCLRQFYAEGPQPRPPLNSALNRECSVRTDPSRRTADEASTSSLGDPWHCVVWRGRAVTATSEPRRRNRFSSRQSACDITGSVNHQWPISSPEFAPKPLSLDTARDNVGSSL